MSLDGIVAVNASGQSFEFALPESFL